jgi:hypothetical protein
LKQSDRQNRNLSRIDILLDLFFSDFIIQPIPVNINFYPKRKHGQGNINDEGKNLPLEKQTKVKKYLEFLRNQETKEDPDNEKLIMSKLFSNLRDEVIHFTNLKYLKNFYKFEYSSTFNIFSNRTVLNLA